MSEPRASFVLCTRNRAEFLDAALTNARSFIAPDDELHIIDGESTDDTAEVVNKHRDIVTTFESVRSGIGHAYNMGFLKAKGRVIVNLTDDDHFYGEGLTTAIQTMIAHPEIDALITGGVYSRCNESTGEITDWGYQFLPEGVHLRDNIRNIFDHTVAGFLILNRRILAKVGLLDTTMQANDSDYMSRLFLVGANFKYLNVKAVRHIEYGHSSQLNSQASNIDLIRLLIRHGRWELVLRYSWADVETALNLSDTTGASAFKWAARTALRVVFSTVNNGFFRVAEQVVRLRSEPNELAKKFGNRFCHKTSAPLPLVEPNWDGSLR